MRAKHHRFLWAIVLLILGLILLVIGLTGVNVIYFDFFNQINGLGNCLFISGLSLLSIIIIIVFIYHQKR